MKKIIIIEGLSLIFIGIIGVIPAYMLIDSGKNVIVGVVSIVIGILSIVIGLFNLLRYKK